MQDALDRQGSAAAANEWCASPDGMPVPSAEYNGTEGVIQVVAEQNSLAAVGVFLSGQAFVRHSPRLPEVSISGNKGGR